uniref:C-type lectin domain-containing protein n=1 Tax=Panagrolaimus davidi TaxID=227884 RepID=A0A914PLU6_9BILA
MIPPTFCNNPCFQGNCIFHQELFGCSALYTAKRTFNDSELECSKNGGHLLSIENSGANNGLSFFDYTDFFLYPEEAWIGMIVATNATGYRILSWTDGTLVMYNNLPLNLTLDANKTYCVSFGFLEKFWKVADCNEKKLFLCSIPNSSNLF